MIGYMERDKELRLIAKAQRQNSDAFDELIGAYMPLIYRLAGRIGSSYSLREELIQAGRIGFMLALSKYDEGKETRLITFAMPWMIGEMKRVYRKQVNDRMTYLPYEHLESEREGFLNGVEKDTQESLLEGIDLKTAFVSLKPEEQKIIALRYFRGKTQKETALLLCKSQAQISKAERRILDRLRCQLA